MGVAVFMGWFAHNWARHDTKCGTSPACLAGGVECMDGDVDMAHEPIFTFGLAFYLFNGSWVIQFIIGCTHKLWPIDAYKKKIPIDGVDTVSMAGTQRSQRS